MIGLAGAGKDTAASFLTDNQNTNFTKFAFASAVKDVCASVFHWPRHLLEGDTEESRQFRDIVDEWWSAKLGIANFTPRKALQLIGTEVFRDNFHTDIWVLSLQRKIVMTEGNVVITDCRFPNEIKILREMGSKFIWVKRGPNPSWFEDAVTRNAVFSVVGRNSIEGQDAYERFKETWPDVHDSESMWAGTLPDIVIENDGTLKDLGVQVYTYFQSLV